jgi:hypothetical protein
MERDELYGRILAACQEYGRTTDHSDELIENLIDSLIAEADEPTAHELAAAETEPAVQPVPYRSVRIPACAEHQGLFAVMVRLPWICPTCGGPRGERIYQAYSFDGSRRLQVDGWKNPCGHVDTYQECRAEYVKARLAEWVTDCLLEPAYLGESRE